MEKVPRDGEESLIEFEGWELCEKPSVASPFVSPFWEEGSINRGIIQGHPSFHGRKFMDESSVHLEYPEALPLLEQLPGTTCEMGNWKQHFCCSAFIRELGCSRILRTRERKDSLCQHPCSLSSLVSLLREERCVLTGRHQTQKSKCDFSCLTWWAFVFGAFCRGISQRALAHLD